MRYLKKIYTLNAEEQHMVSLFFASLTSKISLGRRTNRKVISDYVDAFVIFRQMGVSIEEIIRRLDPTRLGNVYKEDINKWYNLDNSAIVYPLAMGHGSMGMFRLSYYLREEVVPEVLQIALNNIVKRFPVFCTTLRRGFFWHYLDSTKTYYEVKYDNSIPCAILNLSLAKANAFKVYYYEKRISIDFFHILTDGNGGLIFLNTLLAEYLRLLGKNVTYASNVFNIEDKPKETEISDDFYKIPDIDSKSSFKDKFPAQIKGTRRNTRKRVLHFDMNSSKLLELARSKNITVTTLLLGYIYQAIKATNQRNKKDFFIQIPVNMHKFYSSETLRNFALYAIIKENEKDINESNDFFADLQKQLTAKTSKEEMTKMATMTKKLVKQLNYVPLLIKYYILKVIYPFLSEKVITTNLSNIGVVNLPDDISENVVKADFVLGVQNINRAVCSLITIKNITTLSLSMITKDTSFEDELFHLLRKEGIDIEVSGGDNFGI